jgi:hypothetical protein
VDTFPTHTFTSTSTFTLTPTPTLTDTPTFTPTSTPTPTLTPTFTVTSTPTLTPTQTPCGWPGFTCTPTLNPNKLVYNPIAYPNPVKQGQVTFTYKLSVPADTVSLKLFTTAFRKVADFNGTALEGPNSVPYDASSLANGLYYYLLEAKSGDRKERFIGKIIVAR